VAYLPEAKEKLHGKVYKGEGETLCASYAAPTYCLTKSDLSALPCELKRNPHGSSFAEMRLYDVSDLKAACLSRWKTPEKLAARMATLRGGAANSDKRRGIAPKPRRGGGGGGGRRRSRYDDDDDDKFDGSDSGSDSNSLVCDGCGDTAARECSNGRCCHCCQGGCFRHERN